MSAEGRRSGSETRRRRARVTIRLSDSEQERVRLRMKDSGQSAAALARAGLFGAPLPRRRSGRTDEKAIAVLLAELQELKAEWGKQGSNINQIAFQLNADRFPADIREAVLALQDAHDEQGRTLLELRDACVRALGFERDDD
jgi:hypothetical protein